MVKRNAEFALGLIGGIFGFFGAIMTLMIGGISSIIKGADASTLVNLGWSAILFSVLGIVGAAFVKSRNKIGGWFMIIAAVGGLISISLFYLLPFVLLLIGGLMALIRKEK